MIIKIQPSKVSGTVKAPPSKSYTHRAIILASLAIGYSVLENPLFCDDTKATITACNTFGAQIVRKDNKLKVRGTGGKLSPNKEIINCHASGTTLRLMTAIATLSVRPVILTGEKRLFERPIGDLVAALVQLGAKIHYLKRQGYPPIKILGRKLSGGIVTLSADESSQYVSALLLIAPYLTKPLIINLLNSIRSKPYIDLTIDAMSNFGIVIRRKGYKQFRVAKGPYVSRLYVVEGDYTQASYFFAAAAITGGKVTVTDLVENSKQGDSFFPTILSKMGCKVKSGTDRICISGRPKKSMTIDLNDTPDIVQSLAAVAAITAGKTTITNICHLTIKETNRITSTSKELSKMGIKTIVSKDSLTIIGGQPEGTVLDSHGDHRMAMSLATLALSARGLTLIRNAEVVNKSYPTFWQDFERIGAKITLKTNK